MADASFRFLVFQHIDIETPGVFLDFMRESGVEWDTVELDAGDRIPKFDGYDALLVMGGPMDVWEEDEHPWFKPEKVAIRRWVAEERRPYFGFCLGHQLLGAALGGDVGKAKIPEVGIMAIELSAAGRASPIFAGLPARQTCLQWHGAEVSREPEGAVVLASSPACRVQSMAVGDRAFSIQFHLEMTPTTVADWAEVPAYKAALDRSLGEGGFERLKSETDRRMKDFNRDARRLYDNFLGQVRAWKKATA